jgi:hypothetical protein
MLRIHYFTAFHTADFDQLRGWYDCDGVRFHSNLLIVRDRPKHACLDEWVRFAPIPVEEEGI